MQKHINLKDEDCYIYENPIFYNLNAMIVIHILLAKRTYFHIKRRIAIFSNLIVKNAELNLKII